MADSSFPISPGTGASGSVDVRTESTNSNLRQVVVLGDPLLNNNVAAVATQDLPSSDQTTPGIVVRSAGSLSVSIAGSSGTLGVHVGSTGGTLAVLFNSEPTVIASGKHSTTTRPFIVNTDGAIKIYDIATGTISTVSTVTAVTNITNSVAVHVLSTGGTISVQDKSEPTVISSGKDGTTTRALRMNSDGAIKVYDLAGGTVTANVAGSLTGITNTVAVYFDRGDPGVKITSGTVTGITNSIQIHIVGTSGTLITKLDPAGTAFVNAGHTASIFTVSGSTSGGTTSGVTLVAPSASYNFKVFAYSIQTTGIVSAAIRFTNGAGSETELWRPLITASETTSTPKGANLAVAPPGFIFATGTNTTLALKNDAGSLVHYSVSYIKESS